MINVNLTDGDVVDGLRSLNRSLMARLEHLETVNAALTRMLAEKEKADATSKGQEQENDQESTSPIPKLPLIHNAAGRDNLDRG